MLAYAISVNGKRCCTIGIGTEGGLFAAVDAMVKPNCEWVEGAENWLKLELGPVLWTSQRKSILFGTFLLSPWGYGKH